MSYSLNIWGVIWGTIMRVIKEDTRSLDYSSYGTSTTTVDTKAPGFRVGGLGFKD